MSIRPEPVTFRVIALCLMAVLCAAQAVAQSSAHASDVDLPAFVSEMDRLSYVIANASPREAVVILTTMPHTYHVRDGQEEFSVPFERFAQRLAAAHDAKRWTSERQRILDDLRLVRNEAAARQHWSPSAPDPQPALAAILSRREFRASRNAEWSAELRRWITEWLQGLWRRLGGDRLNSRTTALALASLAILIGTVSFAVWLIRRSTPKAVWPRTGLQPGPALSSHAWAVRAIAAARSGDTRETARCAYRAALGRLEEQGIWQIDEARTAREYLRLLQPEDPKRDLFGALVRRFELAWFARAMLTRDDLIAVGDSLEKLGCLNAHERAI